MRTRPPHECFDWDTVMLESSPEGAVYVDGGGGRFEVPAMPQAQLKRAAEAAGRLGLANVPEQQPVAR